MALRSKRKLLHIVGNRPQFIKLAAMLRALPEHEFSNVIVHSGQHYDHNMSKIFFDELGISEPDYFLNTGPGNHDTQTAKILEALNPLWQVVHPEIAVIYGDTNTTLAAALSAYKSEVPLAHVEAGMREFTWRPEEINKKVADHCSDYCFCPSELAVTTLRSEGIHEKRIFLTGDVTYDSFLWAAERIRDTGQTVSADHDAVLVTLHRAETVDCDEHLAAIAKCLIDLQRPIYFPVHPRTKKRLQKVGLWEILLSASDMHVLPPLGYFEFLAHLLACSMVITDSGTVTKEAYYANKPTLVLDDTSEYMDLVAEGMTVIVGRRSTDIGNAIQLATRGRSGSRRDILGNGKAAERIADILRCFPNRLES